MAKYYAKQFVGVRDGTQPPLYADGRMVDAKERVTRADKDNINALAAGDQIYLGRFPAGCVYDGFSAITDTSFGTTTISIGTLAAPTKYVNAKTLTGTDAWTALGPPASVALQAPLLAEEELWATLGVGGVAAAVIAGFKTKYTISA